MSTSQPRPRAVLRRPDRFTVVRAIVGAAGVALLLFGVGRLLTEIPTGSLVSLGIWLVAALIIHDGVLSPVVITVGVLLRRFVPDRARRFLQFFLIAAAVVSVVAIPMIVRQGSQPAQKALLQQNYGLHLTLIIAGLGVITLIGYAVRVARDHQPVSSR